MIIDIVFMLCMVFSLFKGYRNGLIVGVFSLAGVIIGLVAAVKLSAMVAERLKESTQITAAWLPFVSFALIMIIVVLLVRMGAAIVQGAIEFAMLGWLNKLGGILLYATLYVIVLSVLLFYAEKLSLLSPAAIAASKTYAWIQPLGPKVIEAFGAVIPVFKGMFAELSLFFENIGKAAK